MNDPITLVYHPGRVQQWLSAQHNIAGLSEVYPIFVEISLVGSCNHHCAFCYLDYASNKPVRLDAMLLQKRIEEMARLGVKAILFSGEGEPLLHRKIAGIVETANQHDIAVAFQSNAVNMDDEFIETVLPKTHEFVAAINAGTPGTYSKIHNTKPQDFNLVVGQLKKAIRFRQQTNANFKIGAQCVLLPNNANEMERLALVCRDDIGLDFLRVNAHWQNQKSLNRDFANIDYLPFLAVEKKLAKLGNDRFSINFSSTILQKARTESKKPYDRCHATPHFWAYIMADGSVYGCNQYLGDDRFKYGNINYDDFQSIWQSQRRQQAIDFMRENFSLDNCPVHCKMDAVNNYLETILRPNQSHGFL